MTENTQWRSEILHKRKNYRSPPKPLYHENQMLRIKTSIYEGCPSRPVIDIKYDEHWQCWTYLFPLSLIMEREDHLEPTGEPDMKPGIWLDEWIRNKPPGTGGHLRFQDA